ncbi:MAG: hypothetical protein V4857_12645 [Pseudomonadota bacterium]
MKVAMKNEKLTTDEYDALEHILRGAKHDRVNACVGRNAKRLSGLKMVQYSKDGKVALTDKGHQTLFVRRCIIGLRALAQDPVAAVEADVALFLGKKSHIVPLEAGGFQVTDKGRESLADMDAQDQLK